MFLEPVTASGSHRSVHRNTKRVLRFLPRKAVLHKYPLIGRFAAQLRRRHYLWSLRREHMRSAYYAGSVISFLPLMGIQLPVALVAALVLRSNFMILGGLQFLTNPFTAAPIYLVTHQVGAAVVERIAPEERHISSVNEQDVLSAGEYVSETITHPIDDEDTPGPVRWTERVRHALLSLTVGGVLVGFLVGLVLDLGDLLLRRRAPRSRPATVPGP